MKGVLRLCIQVSLMLLLLSACSGGGDSGGGSEPQEPQRSSNWDQMVWDQDSWK